jgi:hypothetical protein
MSTAPNGIVKMLTTNDFFKTMKSVCNAASNRNFIAGSAFATLQNAGAGGAGQWVGSAWWSGHDGYGRRFRVFEVQNLNKSHFNGFNISIRCRDQGF